MKPGLLWSDGEPLTLNDFTYTLRLGRQGRRRQRLGCTGCATMVPLIDVVA